MDMKGKEGAYYPGEIVFRHGFDYVKKRNIGDNEAEINKNIQ